MTTPVQAPLRVTVWNENRHENYPDSLTAKLYPTGMHGAIAEGLTLEGPEVIERQQAVADPAGCRSVLVLGSAE